MARLTATTFVRHPDTHQMTQLPAGSEPPPHLAALVTNPDCWADGKPPAPAKETSEESQEPEADNQTEDTAAPGGDEDTKPAAKKTAATRPARGRKSAAAEGSSD